MDDTDGAGWSRHLAVIWLLVLFGACTSTLPSAEPLGSGPLAEAQADEDLPDRPAGKSKAAGSGAEDAGVDSKTDAGSADASERAEKDVTDADAATAAEGGAGGQGSGDAGAASFEGEYAGTDVTTMRWEGQGEQSHPDPKARVCIESESDAEVTIIVIYTPTGGPFCSLSGTVAGNSANIGPGQTCPDEGLDLGFSGVVTSGKATLEGDRLVLEIEADIEAERGNDTISGKLEYRFEGDR